MSSRITPIWDYATVIKVMNEQAAGTSTVACDAIENGTADRVDYLINWGLLAGDLGVKLQYTEDVDPDASSFLDVPGSTIVQIGDPALDDQKSAFVSVSGIPARWTRTRLALLRAGANAIENVIAFVRAPGPQQGSLAGDSWKNIVAESSVLWGGWSQAGPFRRISVPDSGQAQIL